MREACRRETRGHIYITKCESLRVLDRSYLPIRLTIWQMVSQLTHYCLRIPNALAHRYHLSVRLPLDIIIDCLGDVYGIVEQAGVVDILGTVPIRRDLHL